MKRILIMSICVVFGLSLSAQNWTGKFQLVQDPSDGRSFILQVVPDNSGTDEIAASGTAAYIVLPAGLAYTATDLNASWTTSTLGSVSGGLPCGDLVQSTMESDLTGTFTAGVPVDLVKYTLTTPMDCASGEYVRLMENNDGTGCSACTQEPCAGIDAGSLDQGFQTGSNSGAYTGNLTTSTNPLTCESILPVELTGFGAEAKGLDAELSWETASELNNSHFEVERSVDGRSWDYVGRVEGKGTTGREQAYSYTDVGIGRKLSTVYYRLLQVDYDGSEIESEVRVVNFEDRGGEVSIYPNPVRDELNVNYSGGSTYRVLIYDMMGKLVSESRGDSKIDMSVYKGGTYTVRVLDGSGLMLKTESVVVIR